MNVTFSVPTYPAYRQGLAGLEYKQHDMYLQRFESYANMALKLQMMTALKAADKFAAGDGRAAIELEVARLKDVADAFAAAAQGVVERTTLAVDTEMASATRAIEVGVKALVTESTSDVMAALSDVRDRVEGSTCSHASPVADSVVSEKTLANRAKRHARAELKRARKANAAVGVRSGGLGSSVDEAVPEWRRKDVRALHHKGVFADCSEDVQVKLRESRAEMLIAKNKTATVGAEHKRRTMEARLKSRVVEEEVELKRMEVDAANKKLIEGRDAKLPAGFAETVTSMGIGSVFDVGSRTSGSVSPDSSISVAELAAKNAALVKLTKRVAELEAKVVKGDEALKAANAKAERFVRRRPGLPTQGPGSGIDGYGVWD